MSDIDHKAEAESRIDWTFRGGATDSERASMVAKAQVHATLYLAEQNLAANLIAWTTRPGYKPNAETQARIEKALGLA